MTFYYTNAKGLCLNVWVKPNAAKTNIIGVVLSDTEQPGKQTAWLKIALHGPPVDGKANQILLAYLADILDLKQRQLEITHGLSSKMKYIQVYDPDEEVVIKLHKLQHEQ